MSFISLKNEAEEGDFLKSKAELEELLSRFGWKWAILVATVGKMHEKGIIVSNEILKQIRMARTQITSGCYSVCDVASSLREIEKELFSMLVKTDPQEVDLFLELISKAIGGKITKKDIDLTGAKPILSDCLTLPCVCRE